MELKWKQNCYIFLYEEQKWKYRLLMLQRIYMLVVTSNWNKTNNEANWHAKFTTCIENFNMELLPIKHQLKTRLQQQTNAFYYTIISISLSSVIASWITIAVRSSSSSHTNNNHSEFMSFQGKDSLINQQFTVHVS